MKLEKLEDLLEINTDELKAPENKRLLTRLKQLLKSEIKQEVKADEIAEDFPYDAVSIVGNKIVHLKFDLTSKKARVTDSEVDGRDVRGKNHMALAKASVIINRFATKQKELTEESNE